MNLNDHGVYVFENMNVSIMSESLYDRSMYEESKFVSSVV